MPRLALVVALLTSTSVGQAQDARNASRAPDDGRVLGVVLDENDGTPVRDALVFLSDGRITNTNDHGQFSFPHVRPGDHQIAAVTHGCFKVEGGFSVASGEDSQLRLMVDLPSRNVSKQDRGRGTSVTVLERSDLVAYQERPLWYAIERMVPYHLDRTSRGTVMRSTRAATMGSAEPLLVMDGVKMSGDVHRVLNNLSTADVARVEIFRGAAGGWEFGYGGENGVIVVTTRVSAEMGPDQPPESCVRMH
jgi:hypothetical protein